MKFLERFTINLSRSKYSLNLGLYQEARFTDGAFELIIKKEVFLGYLKIYFCFCKVKVGFVKPYLTLHVIRKKFQVSIGGYNKMEV